MSEWNCRRQSSKTWGWNAAQWGALAWHYARALGPLFPEKKRRKKKDKTAKACITLYLCEVRVNSKNTVYI